MKQSTTIAVSTTLAVKLIWSCSLAAGIPEPPLVLYGSIQDNSTGARITSGTLVWTWQPVSGGSAVILITTLTNLNDQFSFVVRVPCESKISGQEISENTASLANPNVTYLRGTVTWNGQPLAFKDSAQSAFIFGATKRGAVERIDLGLGTFTPDTDGDGLPDWWETKYPSAGEPDVDTDGDRLNNRDEYQAGTDPTDPASSFRFVYVIEDVPGQFLVQWSSVPGKIYSILRSPILSTNSADYKVIREGIASEGTNTSFRDFPTPGSWFYRVLVTDTE